MNRLTLSLAAVLMAAPLAAVTADDNQDGWVALFDGSMLGMFVRSPQPMLTPRRAHNAVVLGNFAYGIAGHAGGPSPLSSIEVSTLE